MEKELKKVLGLDLGTNSIGWALLQEDESGNQCGIIDMGSRIFIKSVQDKTPTPKNHARRAARLARRTVQRRAARHKNIQKELINLGWLPAEVEDIEQRERILNQMGDPYQLRKAGLDTPLEPHQLGRALLNLGIRRGFLSTRVLMIQELIDDPDLSALIHELENGAYTGDQEAEADLKVVKSEQEKEETTFKKDIADLQHNITQGGFRTLGEYLASIPNQRRKRTLRTSRAMYQDELKQLFEAQKKHHPNFTQEVYDNLYRIMFHQRPITWDKNTIGKCSLEPKLIRTHSARSEYQRFRYLQDLSNLQWDYAETVIDEETGEITGINIKPTATDREKLIALLEQQKTLSWSAIRKALGLDKKIKFNLEEKEGTKGAKTKGLMGNQTACDLRKITSRDNTNNTNNTHDSNENPHWDNLSQSQQAQLIEDLLSYEHVSGLKIRLINHWKFDLPTTLDLINYSREINSQRANLSLKAIRKLLPYLEQGLRYDEARVQAGYGYEQQQRIALDKLPAPPDLRNPIVQKALYEVRRVVNAVIQTYGKPEAIRIELPRELTMSKKQKEAYDKQQKANQTANEEAKEQYQNIRRQNPHLNLPERPSRDDLLKYRLWQEQNKVCPYSGSVISATQVFNPNFVEIEHILPYKRTLNDSYMNKVLALTEENRYKKDQTPFEAYHGEKYEQIIERTKNLPKSKRNAFLCRDLKDLDNNGATNDQMPNTGYISLETVSYVQQLYSNPSAVTSTKGSTTEFLRRTWGLNTLLGHYKKNREDHRHHAIDAAVIAVTNRATYNRWIRAAKAANNTNNIARHLSIEPPWETFRADLEHRIETIIISHASNRKITGALHEATAYGLQPKRDGSCRVVYKKPLDISFTKENINKVLDPSLKQFLTDHLARFNGNAKAAFSPENRPTRHSSQGSIRHVRVIAAEKYNPDTHLEIKDKRISNSTQKIVFKRYPLGNNHHVEILKNNTTGKIKGAFVTTHEAAQRVSRKQPIIQREHGEEWTFLMCLCINDMVKIEIEGKPETYRIQKLDPSNNRLVLREHRAATLDNKEEGLVSAISFLVEKYKVKLLSLNALGHQLNDQTNS